MNQRNPFCEFLLRTRNTNQKEHTHLCNHCSATYNSQDLERAQCPSVHEWIQKLWHLYTMGRRYSATKRKELLPLATAWMHLESIMLSEISQSEKDKYHVIFTSMWNLMNTLTK